MDCECHGVEMQWTNDKRYKAGGYWRCVPHLRERERKNYEKWTGMRYNRRLLQLRRYKAMVRQRQRHTGGV